MVHLVIPQQYPGVNIDKIKAVFQSAMLRPKVKFSYIWSYRKLLIHLVFTYEEFRAAFSGRDRRENKYEMLINGKMVIFARIDNSEVSLCQHRRRQGYHKNNRRSRWFQERERRRRRSNDTSVPP